ncbi:putative membrane protein [Anaplasma phagocytophilum str. ApMUC09]|uniref:Putative membrane protein n=1 Tax=Anaplasma phagocytophilum str. ApMUC09 TaxID=1359152 RepID=A0A0F3N873_ANAPH|nr:putative membrane protein [Anaplasma phagocytophilum str. ApMUC09]
MRMKALFIFLLASYFYVICCILCDNLLLEMVQGEPEL